MRTIEKKVTHPCPSFVENCGSKMTIYAPEPSLTTYICGFFDLNSRVKTEGLLKAYCRSGLVFAVPI